MLTSIPLTPENIVQICMCGSSHYLQCHTCPDLLLLASTHSEDICTFSNLKFTPYHHQQPQEWTGGAEGTNFPFDQLPTLPKPGQDITNNNRNNNGLAANNNEDETTDITDTTTIGAALPDTPTITATLPDTPTSLPPSPRGPLEIHVVPSREIGGKQYSPNEVRVREVDPGVVEDRATHKHMKL